VLEGDYDCINLSSRTIYGNNAVVDGQNKYSGFKVGGKYLNIKDLTMRCFVYYKHTTGCVVGEMKGGELFVRGANINISDRVNFENNEAMEKGT
jgi:hypothetical protein